jgi:hypothetical protein
MPTWTWIVIAIGAVVVVAAVLLAAARRRRSTRLRGRFGPEYDRVVDTSGSRRTAEGELRDREARREELEIVPLTAAARERYGWQWRNVQTRFVDTPTQAVSEAGRLVQDVMRERGYPIEDFERRAADISVDHPRVAQNYRKAHAISTRNEQGQTTTEDLRQAMMHYRALFEELLGDPVERGSDQGVRVLPAQDAQEPSRSTDSSQQTDEWKDESETTERRVS